MGHKSFEFPKNEKEGHIDAYVAKSEAIEAQELMGKNALETGEDLMMNKVLLKPYKETFELAQRKTLYRVVFKDGGTCCKVVIDSGRSGNLVSTKMVEKLGLKRLKHPTPYKVSWLYKGH